jgi:hypothetical protein
VSAPAKTKGTRKTENKKVAQKTKKDRDAIEDMLAKKGIDVDEEVQEDKRKKKAKKLKVTPVASMVQVFAEDLERFTGLLTQFETTMKLTSKVGGEGVVAAVKDEKHAKVKRELNDKESGVISNAINTAFPRDVRAAIPVSTKQLRDPLFNVILRAVFEYFMVYTTEMQAMPERLDVDLHFTKIKDAIRIWMLQRTHSSRRWRLQYGGMLMTWHSN